MPSSGKEVSLISSCFAVVEEFCEGAEQGQSLIWLNFDCSRRKIAEMLLIHAKSNQREASTGFESTSSVNSCCLNVCRWQCVGGLQQLQPAHSPCQPPPLRCLPELTTTKFVEEQEMQLLSQPGGLLLLFTTGLFFFFF